MNPKVWQYWDPENVLLAMTFSKMSQHHFINNLRRQRSQPAPKRPILHITFQFTEVTNSRCITKMHTAGITGTFLCTLHIQSYSCSVSIRNMLFILYSECTLLPFPKMWHVQYQHINTAQLLSCKTHLTMAKPTLICHTMAS